jgi:hypothetical protein
MRAANVIRGEFIDVTLRGRRTLLGAAVFALVYVSMSIWFQTYDVYNRFFTQTGPIYAIYHFWKVVSIFYIVWLVCFISLALMDMIQKSCVDFALGELDRLISAFYIGGAAIAIFDSIGRSIDDFVVKAKSRATGRWRPPTSCLAACWLLYITVLTASSFRDTCRC